MTKLLLAGGAGFDGSPLADRLLRRTDGTSLAGVDRLWAGRRETPAHVEDPRLRIVPREVERFDADGSFDRTYPLASPASPPRYGAEPLRSASAR